MSDIDTTYMHVKHRPIPMTPSIEPLAVWQTLWFEIRRHAWHSLALVPVEDGTVSLRAATLLHEVGRVFEGPLLAVLDATHLTLGAAHELLAAVEGGTGSRLVAVDSPLDRPSALPIVAAADAALLVLTLGESTVPEAEKVIEEVGPKRFIGAISVPHDFGLEDV